VNPLTPNLKSCDFKSYGSNLKLEVKDYMGVGGGITNSDIAMNLNTPDLINSNNSGG
jgi:hypothetical protein